MEHRIAITGDAINHKSPFKAVEIFCNKARKQGPEEQDLNKNTPKIGIIIDVMYYALGSI